jgi:hypothetical protein
LAKGARCHLAPYLTKIANSQTPIDEGLEAVYPHEGRRFWERPCRTLFVVHTPTFQVTNIVQQRTVRASGPRPSDPRAQDPRYVTEIAESTSESVNLHGKELDKTTLRILKPAVTTNMIIPESCVRKDFALSNTTSLLSVR